MSVRWVSSRKRRGSATDLLVWQSFSLSEMLVFVNSVLKGNELLNDISPNDTNLFIKTIIHISRPFASNSECLFNCPPCRCRIIKYRFQFYYRDY